MLPVLGGVNHRVVGKIIKVNGGLRVLFNHATSAHMRPSPGRSPLDRRDVINRSIDLIRETSTVIRSVITDQSEYGECNLH